MNPCCFELKTGVLIIGAFEVIFYGIYCIVTTLAIILTEIAHSRLEVKNATENSTNNKAHSPDPLDSFELYIYWGMLVRDVFGIILGIILVVGIRQNSAKLLQFWIIRKPIVILASVALVIFSVVKGLLRLSALIPDTIFILVGIYFVVVIFYYHKTTTSSTHPIEKRKHRSLKRHKVPGPVVETPTPTPTPTPSIN